MGFKLLVDAVRQRTSSAASRRGFVRIASLSPED